MNDDGFNYGPGSEEEQLRAIFDAYSDRRNDFFGLLNTLGSVQKQFGEDWKEHVIGCMYGMELHDAGLFPAEWLEEIEDDALEAYNNARMKQQS